MQVCRCAGVKAGITWASVRIWSQLGSSLVWLLSEAMGVNTSSLVGREGIMRQRTGPHLITEGVGGAWEVTDERWPKVPPVERWPKVPPTSGREERGNGKLEEQGEFGSLEDEDWS